MRNTMRFAALAAAGALAMTAGTAVAQQGFEPSGTMERSAIPHHYKWQLDSLFVDDQAFDSALADQPALRERLLGCKGQLSAPEKLNECLEAYFVGRLALNKLTLYANLRHDSHQRSAETKELSERSLSALSEFMQVTSFIRQEVLALSDDAVAAAYKAVPALERYRPHLDEIGRMRAHVLSPEAERVLSLAGDNMWAEIDLNEIPSDFEKAFGSLISDLPLPTITDEAGKPVQLTLASYGKYRSSADRRVRKEAVSALFSSLHGFRNALAAVLAGQARFTVFLARAHGFDTALDAYLERDSIDPAVYKNLISSVRANIGPLHRYVALRKAVMGLDEVHLYDLYPPLVAEVDMKFTFEEARKILPLALAPLGDAYLAQLEVGLDPNNGWIDVYPHKDKDSGAFAASVYGAHPFVKMNWFDDLESLSTLAHEYGHAIHSHLAMTHQSEITWSYKPFIAEIASTINEKLLSDYLVAHAKTDDERLFLLNQLVETLRTTIYRQAMFAEFELGVHTAVEMGEPITADMLDEMYRELVRDYYGPDFTVGEHDGIEWAYVPHFYYKYYVFSYATGLSSGLALAELIQTKGAPARDAFLGMLAGGSSKPPLELLQGAGVDLTKPDAINAAARLFDATLAEMEKLLERKAKKAGATRS